MLYRFEEPTFLPAILQTLKTAGVPFDDDLRRLEKEVTRPLTVSESKEMRQRLKGWYFRSVEQVPWWYPAFAYRGIALRQFSIRTKEDYHAHDAHEVLMRRHQFRTRCNEFHYRYKHQRQLITQPYDNHGNKWRHCRCNCGLWSRQYEMPPLVQERNKVARVRRETLAREVTRPSSQVLSSDRYTTQ